MTLNVVANVVKLVDDLLDYDLHERLIENNELFYQTRAQHIKEGRIQTHLEKDQQDSLKLHIEWMQLQLELAKHQDSYVYTILDALINQGYFDKETKKEVCPI